MLHSLGHHPAATDADEGGDDPSEGAEPRGGLAHVVEQGGGQHRIARLVTERPFDPARHPTA